MGVSVIIMRMLRNITSNSSDSGSYKKVSKIALEDHIDTCLLESVEKGTYEKELNELKASLATLL